jgi:hypothetical protein
MYGCKTPSEREKGKTDVGNTHKHISRDRKYVLEDLKERKRH